MIKLGILRHVGVALVIALVAFDALPSPAQQPVVVELFTSEGCSSCPPADALLGELNRHHIAGVAELILLAEHVEYWNSPSWTDRFSSPIYTQRQGDYVKQLHLATAYTPQMVIDGHFQTVGSDAASVQRLIAQASSVTKPAAVSLRFDPTGRLQVGVGDSSQGRSRVLLAITEDALTTNVKGGENGGRLLKHSAVVREMRPLGTTSNGKFETTLNLPAQSDWKKPDLRAVVLVQNPGSGQILGAASIAYPPAGSASAGR
jgi:hypothetical protein